MAFRRQVDQCLHASHGSGRIPLQQAFNQAGFATDTTRLLADDTLGNRFGLRMFTGHVVQAQACLKCRQMLGHRCHPALDSGHRTFAAHLLDRQPRQPHVVQLVIVFQHRVQSSTCFILTPQALP